MFTAIEGKHPHNKATAELKKNKLIKKKKKQTNKTPTQWAAKAKLQEGNVMVRVLRKESCRKAE